MTRVVAHMALETDAPLGMRRHRHVGVEALRVAAPLVAGLAGVGPELLGGDGVRNARWRTRDRRAGSEPSSACAGGPSVPCGRRARSPACREWCGTPAPRRGSAHRVPPASRQRWGRAPAPRPGGRTLHRDAQRGHGRDARADQEQAQERVRPGAGRGSVMDRSAAGSRSTRTAHLLASGCPESGQQASSVSRFTGRASSNDGTKTCPRRGLGAIVDAGLDLDRAAAAHQADGLAVPNAESRRVLAIDLDVGVRERAMQRRNALRHRARTPVLEHGARREPERILAVWRLGRRLVGSAARSRHDGPHGRRSRRRRGRDRRLGRRRCCSATASRGPPRTATSRRAARAARRWGEARLAVPHESGGTPPRSARRDGPARRGRASRSRDGGRPRSSARRRRSPHRAARPSARSAASAARRSRRCPRARATSPRAGRRPPRPSWASDRPPRRR